MNPDARLIGMSSRYESQSLLPAGAIAPLREHAIEPEGGGEDEEEEVDEIK